MVDKKILIGIPTGEYARRADFYDYRDIMEKPMNTMMFSPHGASPATNRNLIIQQAQDHNCSHILFMDDDVAPRKDALMQLLEHENVDIVSGLILRREYPHQPLVFDTMLPDGRALYTYLEKDTPRLIPMAAAGFGFILVKTSVFNKMEKPYFRLGELDPCEWCDDIGFFYRLRGKGLKMFCDTHCKVGHIGTVLIWPNFEDGTWYTGYDTNGKQMLNTPQISAIGGSKVA